MNIYLGNYLPSYFIVRSRRRPITNSIQLMYSWVTYHGNWDTTVKDDVLNIIEHYKAEEGITSVGIFGFCWGGKISVLVGTQIPGIRAAGLVHPSGVLIEEADHIKCPVIVCPSKDEHNFVIPPESELLEFLEIGRASCRERV